MLRAVVVAVACVAAAVVVSAGRVKEVPPGFYKLMATKIKNPGCNAAADEGYAVLTGKKEYIGYKLAHTDINDYPKYAFSKPGTTLCNGHDRVIFLSMGLAPKNQAVVSHHTLLHTYGGGKYAMLYQSYSGDYHKDAEGKSYNMADYIDTMDVFFKTGKDGALGNLPPVLQDLPCECKDMADWLQGMLDQNDAKALKAAYNRMFTPQNDKQNVRGGYSFFGKQFGEKDVFQLYVFQEGVPLQTLKSTAFIEAAAVHATQQRIKSPAALLDLKRARKQPRKHLRPANGLQH